MKCIEYRELISAYVDEMLNPQEEEQLITHLKTCQACREEVEILKEMRQMCQQMEEVSLPEGFHEDLMKQLKREEQVKSPIIKFAFRWQYGGALVATMLVGILFFSQLGTFSSRSKQVEENATTEAAPYAMQSNVAEASLEDAGAAAASDVMPKNRAIEMQEEMEPVVWQVQVENQDSFLEALKAYLDEEQMTYENTKEGITITQLEDSKALITWVQSHSITFSGEEVTTLSDIMLEIK